MGPAIISTTLLDLLNYINKETVIVKMDVESYECKILFQYLTHPHPSCGIFHLFKSKPKLNQQHHKSSQLDLNLT